MNKKLCSLICFMLILGAIIPVAFAGRPDKGTLEKIVFKRYAKPPHAAKPDKPDDDEGYYTLLRKGVEWKTLPVKYYIDITGSGLSEEFVTSTILESAEEWDSETTAELFNETYTVITDGSWDSSAPDGRNEIVFGNYEQDGVIAVTMIWGYFGGPPGQRRIVEFDIMFDTDYEWGTNDVTNVEIMDLQNIATHEFGHGAGLGDLYNSEASEETMYGYSWYGDIEKRDLYLGDIAGIQVLYDS